MKKLLCFVTIILGVIFNIQATLDISSTFLSTKDGLPSNHVRYIFQDNKGFIWFGTQNGLARYDGYSFVSVTSKNKPFLAGKRIERIEEDKQKCLWLFISPGYIACYDVKKEEFIDFIGNGNFMYKFRFRMETSNGDTWLWNRDGGCCRITIKNGDYVSEFYNTNNKKLSSDEIMQIREDKLHNIWICTKNGITRVCNTNVEHLGYGYPFSDILSYENKIFLITPNAEIYKITEKNNLKIICKNPYSKKNVNLTTTFSWKQNWAIITSSGGYLFNLESEDFSKPESINFPDGRIATKENGYIWLYDRKGVIRYINTNNGDFADINIPYMKWGKNPWCRVVVDSHGLVWIATFGDGLYIYNRSSKKLKHINYRIGHKNYISSNTLEFITKDNSGAIWIATEQAGLSCLRVMQYDIDFIYPANDEVTNKNNSIRLIYQVSDRNEIWVGNRSQKLFRFNNQMNKVIETNSFPTSIYAVQEINKKEILLGTSDYGIIKSSIDKINKTILPFNSEKRVFSFCRDYKNRIWVAVFGEGLALIPSNGATDSLKLFLKDNLQQKYVRHIATDSYDRIWVGTDNGLYIFHPDSLIKNSQNIYQYNSNNGLLTADIVKYIYKDSKQRMWVGTFGGGVNLCTSFNDIKNLKFKQYTTQHGLVNNVVQSIIEDKKGNIWISTEYGLSRFIVENEHFDNFFFSSVMSENVYGEGSSILLSDGRLVFGTEHGLQVFYPDSINSTGVIPNVELTTLKVNGNTVYPNSTNSLLSYSVSYTDHIKLESNQNSLSITFSAFDYGATVPTKYSYKLEGYDQYWSIPSISNIANYQKLPPGKYRLWIKACNDKGQWINGKMILNIIINPPIWLSRLAFICYFIIAIVIFILSFLLIKRFNTLRNQIIIEKRMTDYKIKFFTNISHEFRSPLTLIKGSLDRMENIGITNEYEYPFRVMKKSIFRMMRLIEQLMEFQKVQLNKQLLHLRKTDINSFISHIYEYYIEAANDKHISYHLQFGDLEQYVYIDQDKIDKILHNLLSNALKYTPDYGCVDFNVTENRETKEIIMTVSDTGIGIPANRQHELFSRFSQSNVSTDSIGIGLHLSLELAKRHGGNISFSERNGGGSIFTLTIPIDIKKYNETDFIKEKDLEKHIGQLVVKSSNESSSFVELENKILTKKTKSRILVIEDDTDVRKYLVHELTRWFDVQSVSDGTSGLKAARTFEGDLIICDIMMPGLNGLELTSRLKKDIYTCHIPIILLTAMSSENDHLKGIQSGADAYITKPFSFKLLLAQIIQILERQEILRKSLNVNPSCIENLESLDELDSAFVKQLEEIISSSISDPTFSVDSFAERLGIGRTLFYRKVKGIMGITPNDYIRKYRMNKAMELLNERKYNVSQVAYMVGMNDPHYFGKCFKEHFGISPSIYLRRKFNNEIDSLIDD